MRDWFHEIQRISTRTQLLAAVRTRPERLAGRFARGRVADAFLAAQVEWLCHRAAIRPPRWTRDPCFVLDRPWFALPSPRLRTHLLLDTPDEFRNRNLFTTPEVRLNIRRGRPAASPEHRREMNRLRQQRFRARRGQVRAAG